jgi:hypothetical protein
MGVGRGGRLLAVTTEPAVRRNPAHLAVWAPVGLLAVLGGLYLWELVTMSGVPFARDMQMFFIPQKHLLAEALREGRVPLWSPNIGTGAPFLANFQSGVFYPPHWLYAVLPFFPAFNLLLVFHFLLGGVGSYSLARKLRLDPTPAFAAAVLFLFGGYFTSLLNLVNALQGAAWAPVAGYVVLDHLERRSVGSLVRLVVVMTLALLAGEPQSFLFTIATAAVIAILYLSRDSRVRRRPVGLVLSLLIGGLVVAGVTMIQLLPTLEYIQESGRGSGGLVYGEASAYSLEPIRLLHLLVPTDYRDPVYSFGLRSTIGRTDPWLFSIYLGALWIPLVYFAWRNRSRRREVAVWSAVAALGLLLALGGFTPIFPWLFEHLPGFATFRFPEKYFFFTGFAVALLAGFGVEELLADRRSRLDRYLAALLLTIVLGARVAFHFGRDALEAFARGFNNDRMLESFDFAHRMWGQNLFKLLLVVALGLLLIWLHRRARVSTRTFGVLFVSLLTADLLIAHRDLNPVVEQEFYEQRPLLAEHLPIQEVQRDFRLRATGFHTQPDRVRLVRGVPLDAQKWMWQQTLQPNTGQLIRTLQPDQWDAMKPRRYRDKWDFYRLLPEAFRRWNLLRLNSVKYVYSLEALEHERYAREHPLDSLPGRLYELTEPLPRAYMVTAPRYFPDEVAALNAMLLPDFEPGAQVALVDPTGAADPVTMLSSPETSAPPSARILEDEPESVRVALDGEGGSHLVLTDSYYPGWRAFVDGEEREIQLANFFFRAVALRPGDREVVFRYLPRPYERGRAISLATLLLGAVALAIGALGARVRRLREDLTEPASIR